MLYKLTFVTAGVKVIAMQLAGLLTISRVNNKSLTISINKNIVLRVNYLIT